MNEIIINNYVCANDSHNNSKRKKKRKIWSCNTTR